jgi:hypothetical protein
MQRLWGGEISDIAAFGELLQILEWVPKRKVNKSCMRTGGIHPARFALIVVTF